MDAYYGQIMLVANYYYPDKWLPCNGQLMDIDDNTALYSLLGTTYGGNGSTNFALPDLRGRVAIHNGTRPGGMTYMRGDRGGIEGVALEISEIPSHNHAAQMTPPTYDATVSPGCFKGFGTGGTDPEGKYPGPSPAGTGIYYDSASAEMAPSEVGLTPKTAGAVAIGYTGGSNMHENRQPFLTLTYCICIDGIYPPRP